MTPLTQEWLEKAEADFATAHWVAQAPKALADSVCFHAHASVEKHLKARLQEAGIAFPKTHDLELLLNLVLPVESGWLAMRTDLKLLNRFAVEYRYPGIQATQADAVTALEKCTEIRKRIRSAFGLPV